MSLITLLFYFFEFLTAVSTIALLFVRNVFYGALLLIVCLLSLSAIYIFANAEFIAVTQILIYAGGVVVLIVFGIMLTSKFSGKPLVVRNRYVAGGVLVGGFFFLLLLKFFSEASYTSYVAGSSNNSVSTIGILLMSNYVLPFEVAGLLLLITLLGAATIASSFSSDKKK